MGWKEKYREVRAKYPQRFHVGTTTFGRWETIPEFPAYEVAEYGAYVRNRRTGYVMTTCSYGRYNKVNLRRGKKTHHNLKVHELKWSAFVGLIPGGHFLTFANGNRCDANLQNLRVLTPEEYRANAVKIGNVTHLYYVVSVSAGTVKIGVSRAPETRIQSLRLSSATNDLVLVYVDEGAGQNEAAVHKRLRDFCSHGEWFTLSDEMLAFLDDAPRRAIQCVLQGKVSA